MLILHIREDRLTDEAVAKLNELVDTLDYDPAPPMPDPNEAWTVEEILAREG